MNQPVSKSTWGTWIARSIILIGFLVLIARIADLQIVKGQYYQEVANDNRLRRISITAPRGKIIGKDGQIMAGNIETKKYIIFDPKFGYEKSDDVTKATQDAMITEWTRSYPVGDSGAHSVGYVNEATEDEVGKVDPDCPEKGPRKLGSIVGRSGLESQYDCILRGIDGEELIEVDAIGKKVRTIGTKEPIPGQDIQTTLDGKLLEVAKTELEGKKGAVVVTTKDGQVLALYSAPSFDPITLSGNDKKENLPFFNRFMGGAFHPGSPFKIVTATAAIEDQKIAADYTFVDEGVIRVKDYSYNNWYFTQYGKTEGTIGVSKGLARSTDTLFYKLGELVGPTRLSYWALQFGYGAVTGIDLPGEVAGLIPNPEWKIKTKGEPWYLGNSYHMAIGQGDVAATPIQVNAMMATIANNGVWCNPRVNVKTEKKCKDLKLSQVTKDEITKGLIDACHPGGTGVAFFTYPFAVACKTGTAETGIEDDTHAWFTVYGPTDDPQIVVTVLVENGGGGSTVAAPIAKKVFDAWFVSQMP